MPVVILLLLLAVFGYLWMARRGATLTRACRWRADRSLGPGSWRCAVCRAVTESQRAPRHCLRAKMDKRGAGADG